MGEIKIGWSEVSITPKKKVSLAGQFFERISAYVETPITVTAMAVEADDSQMFICSCDIVGIATNLLKLVRKNFSDSKEINPDAIIITATHSHTSMKYSRIEDIELDCSLDVLTDLMPKDKKYVELVSTTEDVMSGEEALYFLTEKITEAIKSAWKNRKRALISNQFGRAAVGMCRRVCYNDGSAKMWGDTNTATFTELETGNDSGIELLYVFDENKKLTGVVINIACPAQVVEQRNYISSDYWGKVKILLREKFGEGLFILGLCAPAGDQCPRDLVRWIEPETPIDDPNVKRENVLPRKADPSMYDIKGTWKIGKRIAREIIDVYEEIEKDDILSEGVLEHKKFILDVPVRRVTPSEYQNAVKVVKEYFDSVDTINFADNAAMFVYAGTISRFQKQEEHNIYPVEVHIARLGNIAFATNPFELFLNYGNQIKARSKARQTFLVQLACGEAGYLPTERAEKGSHYSAYVSSGTTGHEGGDILVRKTLEEINKMFE